MRNSVNSDGMEFIATKSQQFSAIRDDPSSDERLRAAILASFAADSRLANADLRVGVVNGIVHLAGVVATLVERAR